MVWDELSAREASIVLGIATPRFSVRLHRAKQRLRSHLTDLADDAPVISAAQPSSRHRQPDPPQLETR